MPIVPQATSATPEADHSLSRLVQQEQLRLTHRQVGVIALSSLGATMVTPFLFYEQVDLVPLIAWLTVAAIGTGLLPTAVLYIEWKRQKSFDDIRQWSRVMVTLTLIAGTAWGSSGLLLFVADSVPHQLLLLLLALAGASLAMITLAAHRPAFYAGVIPMLAPITLRFLWTGDYRSMSYAVIPIIYGITLVYFYRNIHSTLLESIQLRFQLAANAITLAEQKAKAEEANLAKSQFLAAASHDLRQPLHAQGLFVAELKARTGGSPLYPLVTQLEKSTDRMRELFTALLDLSKLDAGAMEAEITDFALQPLFDEIATDYAGAALDRGLKFQVVPTAILVRSDPLLLRRILHNLVANAVANTCTGGVLIGCRRVGNNISIEVHDSGPGIPSDMQQEIFREFYRLSARHDGSTHGFGLGLAIVKRLANLLEHTVEVRSVTDKGSCFAITVTRATTRTPSDYVSPHRVNDRQQRLAGAVVVIVDDDPLVREAMASLLRTWGCVVIAEPGAREMLERAATLPRAPDLIVADYALGETQNGVDLIRALERKFDRRIPAAVITGDTTPERIRRLSNLEYPILHKPLSPTQLQSVLIDLLFPR